MADNATLTSAISSTQARYPDLLKRDVSTALSQFRDLHPSTEHYVFNDGRRALVITLNGTIPVNYKGNTYNIPVCLYLMDTHPYNPPMCYVRPTPDMLIKASSNVDNSGRIYLPYLHQWKYPESDLSGLLQIMTIVFSESCPVFSKSSSSSQLAQQAGQYPGYPPTPYPASGSGSGFMSMPQPTPVTGGGYQPYPPTASGAAGQRQSSWYPQSSGYNSAPYPVGGYHQGYPSTTTSTTPSYPPYPMPSAAQGTGSSGAYSGSNSTTTPGGTYSAATIQPEHIRDSLVSAVQDKLRMKLRESIGTAHAELQSIKKVREDLNSGEQKIKSMLSKIQREQSDLESAMTVYQDRTEEMKKLLAVASESDELSIDDAVDTTAPLYRQLLSSYVEDNAIEDCIYYLCQALKRNKMDLESFLKCVRMLSRQQFQLRAIMLRCRRVAGLDAV